MIRMIKQIVKHASLAVSILGISLTLALSGAVPSALAVGTNGMEGGFTRTFGWGKLYDKVTINHQSVQLPEMRGVGIFRWPDEPFVRTNIFFNGAIPSYQFRYVSAEEAAGCSGTQLPGNRFLSISLYNVTISGQGGVPPVGEVIPIDDGSHVSLALVCTENNTATWSFGLTGDAEIRTGDRTWFDPDHNEVSIVAIDVKD